MSIDHVVRQGEHLAQIAEKYGYPDYKAIWNHPKNAPLKKLRDNPNVLLPGDIVHVPDKREKQEGIATGKTHRMQLRGGKLKLRLALKDFGNEPIKNTKCKITINGVDTPLVTDGNGHIEMPISATVTNATLTFGDPTVPFDLTVPIRIGHLDPVTEISGQRARLSNLGYITRPPEEVDEIFFAHVVQEFQCDAGLTVTGVCDGPTQAKLKSLHGS